MKKLSLEKIDKLLSDSSTDPKLKQELLKKKKALSNEQIIRKDDKN